MQFRRHKAKASLIDVTPLIDVIFLLLIFFMVSTTFITAPGIHVNLPTASSKTVPDQKKPLEFIITEDNKLYLNGRTVAKPQLKAELAAAREKSSETALVIKADGKVPHQLVVDVMDAAKQVGIHKLSIATRFPAQDTSQP